MAYLVIIFVLLATMYHIYFQTIIYIFQLLKYQCDYIRKMVLGSNINKIRFKYHSLTPLSTRAMYNVSNTTQDILVEIIIICGLIMTIRRQIKLYSGADIDDNLGTQLANFHDTLEYFVYFKPFNNGSNINDDNTDSAENNCELEVCESKQATNKFEAVTTDATNERNELIDDNDACFESNYHLTFDLLRMHNGISVFVCDDSSLPWLSD